MQNTTIWLSSPLFMPHHAPNLTYLSFTFLFSVYLSHLLYFSLCLPMTLWVGVHLSQRRGAYRCPNISPAPKRLTSDGWEMSSQLKQPSVYNVSHTFSLWRLDLLWFNSLESLNISVSTAIWLKQEKYPGRTLSLTNISKSTWVEGKYRSENFDCGLKCVFAVFGFCLRSNKYHTRLEEFSHLKASPVLILLQFILKPTWLHT